MAHTIPVPKLNDPNFESNLICNITCARNRLILHLQSFYQVDCFEYRKCITDLDLELSAFLQNQLAKAKAKAKKVAEKQKKDDIKNDIKKQQQAFHDEIRRSNEACDHEFVNAGNQIFKENALIHNTNLYRKEKEEMQKLEEWQKFISEVNRINSKPETPGPSFSDLQKPKISIASDLNPNASPFNTIVLKTR